MGKFKRYFEQVDAAARDLFAQYDKAAKDMKGAKDLFDAYPEQHGHVTAEYLAKRAQAQADYYKAKEIFDKLRKAMPDHEADVARIRRELADEIARTNMARPSDVDMQTLELIKAGVLTGAEYARLIGEMRDAGNPTMIRILGKYASEAAAACAEYNGQNDSEARALRLAAHMAQTETGAVTLHNFDVVADAFKRTMRNPAMMGAWDELTGDIVRTA